METNSTPKFWIITILILLFVGVMMIPITGLVISPKPLPNQIDTPLYELGNYSLNDIWGTPESYDVDTFIMDKDSPITELNNHTLREVFEDGQLITNNEFTTNTVGWNSTGASLSATSGIATWFANSANDYLQYNINRLNGNIYYIVSRLSTTISNKVGISSLGATQGSYHSGSNLYENISIKYVSPGNNASWGVGIIDISTSAWANVLIDSVNVINLTTLDISDLTVTEMDYWFSVYQAIENNDTIPNTYPSILYEGYYITDLIYNKEWSPLYQTTFDLLTDTQIIAQMDLWIANPYQFINYNSFAGWKPSQSQVVYYHELYLYYSNF